MESKEFARNTLRPQLKDQSFLSKALESCGEYTNRIINFFKEENKDKRPDKCCGKPLFWEVRTGEYYSGTNSQCGECGIDYVHKAPSEVFRSINDRSKLYVGKIGKHLFHRPCSSETETLDILLEDEEGLKMEITPDGNYRVKKEKHIYCPQCEYLSPVFFTPQDRLSASPKP